MASSRPAGSEAAFAEQSAPEKNVRIITGQLPCQIQLAPAQIRRRKEPLRRGLLMLPGEARAVMRPASGGHREQPSQQEYSTCHGATVRQGGSKA